MSDKSERGSRPVASPCVSSCAIGAQGLCQGCFRLIDEIAGWSAMSQEEKKRVWLDCAERGMPAERYAKARKSWGGSGEQP